MGDELKAGRNAGTSSRPVVDPQLLSILSRIYVGSITFDLHERHLRAIFGSFGPIKSFNMSYDPSEKRHKGFCFIEFDVPDAANLCVTLLDNINIGGR
jgi:poly(U)-binding-splicing factor PUF60